jgi:hypothetical protein
VKAYRIERIKNGMKFTCTHCAHSVSTLDFDAKAGNLRTQAATAINASRQQITPRAADHFDTTLSSAAGARFQPRQHLKRSASSLKLFRYHSVSGRASIP